HTFFHALLEAFFDRRQKVGRNRAADNRIDPHEIVGLVVFEILEMWKSILDREFLGFSAARKRVHTNVHLAELPAAAGLLLMPIHPLGIGLNRLAVRNLRWFGIDVELVAAMQALANDLQVQFAHAGRNQFLGLRIAVELKRRILLDNFV